MHSGSVQVVRPIGGVEVKLYTFLATAIEGGQVSPSRPNGSLPLGKTRYLLYSTMGGPPGPVWTGAENLAPTGFDHRTVQPLVSLT